MLARSAVLTLVVASLIGCDTDAGGSGGAGGAPTSSSVAATTGATGSVTSAQGTTGASSGAGGLGAELCPTEGPPVGVDVGQRMPSIQVLTCDDEPFSLDELCGAKALWVFAAHGWCPLCQSVSGKQEAWLDEYAPQGLVSVNVLVQDGQGKAPTAAYCKQWRDNYGHADVIQLYDPTGAILQLWPGGSSSLSAFVDADRVIRGKLVHTSDEQSIRAGIEDALAP